MKAGTNNVSVISVVKKTSDSKLHVREVVLGNDLLGRFLYIWVPRIANKIYKFTGHRTKQRTPQTKIIEDSGICAEPFVSLKTLVIVVTSEKTYEKLPKYCFNTAFLENRKSFDLAVIYNGSNTKGVEYIQKTVSPDFFLKRPNIGLDPAAFDHAIKNVPVEKYEMFVLLHDDHWWIDAKWLQKAQNLIASNKADVWGNIVDSSAGIPPNYRTISWALGHEKYQLEDFPFFLQGLAGVYNRKAITTLLARDGVPHIHDNLKETAFVVERVHSFIMLDNELTFGQITPAHRYLRHGDF